MTHDDADKMAAQVDAAVDEADIGQQHCARRAANADAMYLLTLHGLLRTHGMGRVLAAGLTVVEACLSAVVNNGVQANDSGESW